MLPKGYRYPAPKRIAKIKPARIPSTLVPEKETITLIQGRMPGSVEEWRMAMGLYKAGYIFEYQKPVLGGYLPGGQIIDFWITSTYLPTPLYVNGKHWHSNGNIEEYKVAKLKKILRGYIREPVVVWDYELPSVDAAVIIARRRV